jgi:hypothetical protein
LQREVAGSRRPLRVCCGAQHRRQISPQLDSQCPLVWRQDDGVDESSQRLSGLHAGFWTLKGLSQRRHLLAVEVGHLRVEQWRRLVGGLKLRL